MLMIWLAVVGTISQSELCWVALTNQIHTNIVRKILYSDMVMQWHSNVVIWWHGNAVMQWCGNVVMQC